MGAGLALRTWAIATLGGWFTLRVGVQPTQRVVERGPYRWIRLPSYVGAFLTVIGSAVALRAWVAAAIGAVALVAAFRRRVAQEERLLVATLPGYRAYMTRTGAFLPRLGQGSHGAAGPSVPATAGSRARPGTREFLAMPPDR
jgi:protein-S-isoprenylcysteine O-methyltransferase